MSDYISREAACRTIIGLEMRDCTGCRRYKYGIGDDYCFNEALLVASDAISAIPAADVAEAYEAEVKKSRWISVTERLPEPHVKVLCYCRAGIFEVLQWSPDTLVTGWYKDHRTTYMSGFVTHWMPLPPPPKMDESEEEDDV